MPPTPQGPAHWPDMTRSTTPVSETIRLARLPRQGVRVAEDYRGTPDRFGLLRRYELVVPAFRRGCWFASDWPGKWPAGANRVLPWAFGEKLGRLNYGGLFVFLELQRGGYLAIVPIAGSETMTWLNVATGGRLVLNLGTLGTEPVACDAPLFAWARTDDLYTACHEAWSHALSRGSAAGPRQARTYPAVFRYLGWCSWEEYRADITSDLLVDAVRQLEDSPVPVRYVLVDDGHLDHKARRLRSFRPNAKFPDGWKPLLRLRKKDRIRWIGVWHDFNGYWRTIARDNDLGPELNEQLAALPSGALLPRESPGAAAAFYDAFLDAVVDAGFDFVKIDDQATNLAHYRGCGNAVAAGHHCCAALQDACRRRFHGLINCMAHNALCVFTTRNAVTRCSIDYKVGDAAKGKAHIWQSYANTLWLCQTVWGDHDMFHSSDPHAGRVFAVS